MKKIVKYVKRNGKVLGCLVGIGYDEHGGYAVGWSKFNYKAEKGKLNKRKALEIATGRAKNNVSLTYKDWDANYEMKVMRTFPNSFYTEMDVFISRCQRYFKDIHGPRNWSV